MLTDIVYIFLKKILFIFREGGREGKREGEKHWLMCERYIGSVASPIPPTGDLALNSGMYVPWLGIEPVIFGFAGWHSIHWATLARALISFYMEHLIVLCFLEYIMKNVTHLQGTSLNSPSMLLFLSYHYKKPFSIKWQYWIAISYAIVKNEVVLFKVLVE